MQLDERKIRLLWKVQSGYYERKVWMLKPLSPAVDRCVPNDTLQNSNDQVAVEMAPEWETINVKVNVTFGNPRSYLRPRRSWASRGI